MRRALVVVLLLCAFASLLAAQPASPRPPVIDVHVHSTTTTPAALPPREHPGYGRPLQGVSVPLGRTGSLSVPTGSPPQAGAGSGAPWWDTAYHRRIREMHGTPLPGTPEAKALSEHYRQEIDQRTQEREERERRGRERAKRVLEEARTWR